jgi:hypothetical protein
MELNVVTDLKVANYQSCVLIANTAKQKFLSLKAPLEQMTGEIVDHF